MTMRVPSIPSIERRSNGGVSSIMPSRVDNLARGVTIARADACADSSLAAGCDPIGFASQGGNIGSDPMNAPCLPEVSNFVIEGARPLRSVYASIPFVVDNDNIAAGQLGQLNNARGIIDGMKSLGVGDNNAYLASPAASIVFTTDPDVNVLAWGVLLEVDLAIALSQSIIIGVVTDGFTTVIGAQDCDRAVGFHALDTTTNFKLFLPFAAMQRRASVAGGAGVWGPCAALALAATPPTITVTGLPASQGTVSCYIVGPYSARASTVSALIRTAG